VPERMAGRRHDGGAPRHRQHAGIIGVADDGAERTGPERAVAQERRDDRERPRLGREVARSRALVVVAPRVPGERDVVLVHLDRDAQLRPGALGEADVIEVGVGKHERTYVPAGTPEPGQGVQQRVPGAGDPAVDDREAVIAFDDVPVRERVFDSVDASAVSRKSMRGATPGAAFAIESG
jgi:hypothetical protein